MWFETVKFLLFLLVMTVYGQFHHQVQGLSVPFLHIGRPFQPPPLQETTEKFSIEKRNENATTFNATTLSQMSFEATTIPFISITKVVEYKNVTAEEILEAP